MDVKVKMPDLATTEAEVTLVDWLVAEGDAVERGQAIVEIETDKANMEVEAVAAGRLKSILAQPGDAVEVGQVIAIIETAGAPAAKPASGDKPRGMFARNRAAAAKSPEKPPATPAGIALTPAQQTAAQRLTKSKQTVPHFYLETSFHAGPIATQRNAADPKPAWDAFLVWAAALALRDFDRFTHRYDNGKLIPSGTEAVGVAVDLEGVLYVLGIDHPADKSPTEISTDIRRGVERLREGGTEARRLPTVNLTISNLGAANVERFTPVINPPEAALLAVGRLAEVPAVVEGQVAVQLRGNLTLAVDHRVANGRYAADFLGAIVDALENPQTTGTPS